MQKVKVTDEITLKADMRNMYRKAGHQASMQCLYEIIFSAQILIDVIKEESCGK